MKRAIIAGIVVSIALLLFGAALKTYLANTVAVAATSQSDQAPSIKSARRMKAAFETADFIDREMAKVREFPDRYALLTHAVTLAQRHGLWCEWGVFTGGTINHIAAAAPNMVIHGFDSFEGLPEDNPWFADWRKGSFAMQGLPKVRSNVRLWKGWFNKSLPDWSATHSGPITFAHFDADLYSSTKTVFDVLGDRLQPGSVLVFDEFFNYPGWQHGEYKAFTEWIGNRSYEWIGYSREQAAVRLR